MNDMMYLFGDSNPEIAAMIDEPRFRGLVRELYAVERVPIPDPRPSFVERAMACGLLGVDGEQLCAGPRLVPIPAAAEADLSEFMRPALARYVEVADEVVAELRSAYDRSLPSQHFRWPEVSHAVVAGMLLDLAMGQEIVQGGQIRRQPTGDSVVWAFERVSAHNAYGVQWSAAGNDRAFYAQLWHLTISRERGRLHPDVARVLAQTAMGEEVAGATKELLFLRYLGLLRKEGSLFRAQLPVFGPADCEPLLPILIRGGRRLVEDAIVPALEGLTEHPWWQERARQDAYRHAAVRLVLEYGIDRVVAAGVLAPFPDPDQLPPGWGRWLWIEPDGPRSLVPSRVSGRQEAPKS